MRTLSVETSCHGRILIKDPILQSSVQRMLVGFHGYGQSAEDMLSELERIPGLDGWTIVSIQALHRFYGRGGEKVVASWMTRQDREFEIGDNIAYVDRVVRTVLSGAPETPMVFIGFSQGTAMAYRAAVLGSHRVRGVIAVGGDVPPDIHSIPASRFPSLLIAAGDRDAWYNPEKLNSDLNFLQSHGVRAEIFRYQGGHEWTAELCEHLGGALRRIV